MIENLFLCVGAQKSGTTWLHAMLKNHPEVGFSDVKEIHYFNTIHNGSILLSARKVERLQKIIQNNRPAMERYFTNLSCGLAVDPGIKKLLSPVNNEWYIDLFSENQKKYSADFSPEYALLPEKGFQNIKEVSVNQKILFIMRDPVSRAKSAIQYSLRENKTQNNIKDLILDAAKNEFFVRMSRYEYTIEKLNKMFDCRDVLYLFFEETMKNKQKSINGICEFLNIKKIQLSDKIEEKVNSSKEQDFPSEVISYLDKELKDTYQYIHQFFGKIPDGWIAN